MLEKIKNLNKKKKTILASLSVALVLIVTIIIVLACNKTWVYTNAMYALMPKEIVAEMEAGTLKMGVEKSGEKSVEKINKAPLSAFSFYYYDLDGTKKTVGYLENFQFGNEKIEPTLIFSLAANKNLNTLKSVLSKAAIILVIVIIVLSIVLWYRAWSKSEEQQKTGRNKQNKSKKKNKKD